MMPALRKPFFFHDEVPQEQHVHLAAEESTEGIGGVVTMGSPFRLNDVFRIAGIPVACEKR